jgi:hypothetical protein
MNQLGISSGGMTTSEQKMRTVEQRKWRCENKEEEDGDLTNRAAAAAPIEGGGFELLDRKKKDRKKGQRGTIVLFSCSNRISTQ